jgi:hypothetical protein
MLGFCELPTELRQRILALAMPEVNLVRKHWPQSLLNLMRINQQLRSDMGFVVDSWSPIHIVAQSEDVPRIQARSIEIYGRKRSPKTERICLDVFHTSKASQMMTTYWVVGHHYFHIAGYWQDWQNAIAKLPSSATEIWIDVTPAPADMRNRHGLTINSFVHDKRTRRFLRDHSAEVASLIRLVNEHYSGRISIRATGRLSEKSTSFLTTLQIEAGMPVAFDGIWVSGESAVFNDINIVAGRIARTGVGKRAERRGAPNELAWLRDVQWSEQTLWTYAKVAHLGGEEEAAVQDLRNLVNFTKEESGNILAMGPVGAVRRALQHRMAGDLGLKTASEGVEPERRVIVTK